MLTRILGPWTKLKPETKRSIIRWVGISVVTLIVCAAVTGTMGDLLVLIGGSK